MAAGFPLIIITALALIILIAWMFGGSGNKSGRIILGAVILCGLGTCWYILIINSAVTKIGETAMGLAFLIAIAVFFLPSVWKWNVERRKNT